MEWGIEAEEMRGKKEKKGGGLLFAVCAMCEEGHPHEKILKKNTGRAEVSRQIRAEG